MGEKVPLERSDVALRVSQQINYLLMDRRAVMLKWFDRIQMYGPLIRRSLERESAPVDMIYLACILSGMNPTARSRSGGVGWWALGSDHASTTRGKGEWLRTDNWDDRRDPEISTRIAANILKNQKSKGKVKTWILAVCAFLDGEKAMRKALKRVDGFGYWDIVTPTYSELAVPRLIALKIIHTHRRFYAVDTPFDGNFKIESLGRVKLKKDLPLHVIASWIRANPRYIWTMNPGVSPSTGVFPKADRRRSSGYPLRAPAGFGKRVMARIKAEKYM
jgi:membrane-bound lytic murein transglycosylase D